MAMTGQHQNILSEAMTLSEEQLRWQEKAERLIARYNHSDFFNQVADEELQEISSFAHLTGSKVANAFNAFKQVLIALGASDNGQPVRDDENGQAANLINLKG